MRIKKKEVTRIMRRTIGFGNNIRLSRLFLVSHKTLGDSRTRIDRSFFIRLFVCSRVKGWLNRSVRATRERLRSGHCFRATEEFGG